MKHLKFFLDFDGTISTKDVVDAVLSRFAPPEWEAIEREWVLGNIGSRECLSKQLALVRAGMPELEAVLKHVKLDPGFESFLKTATEREVPVTIASDGFDVFIRKILDQSLAQKSLMDNVPVFCNRLEIRAGRLNTFFDSAPCAHGCANCKEAVLKRLTGEKDFTIFVGDGLSDRFAAKASDLVFAKGALLDFCRAHKLKHRAYADFGEIESWLKDVQKNQTVIQSMRIL